MKLSLASLLVLAFAFGGSAYAQHPSTAIAGNSHSPIQTRSDLYLKSALQASIDFPTPHLAIDRSFSPFTVIAATIASELQIEKAVIHVCDSVDGSACSYAYSSLIEFSLDPNGPFQAVWSPDPSRMPFEVSVQFITWITVQDVDGHTYSSPPVPFQYVIPDKRSVRLLAPAAETGLISPATVLLLAQFTPPPGTSAPLDHLEFLDGSMLIGSMTSPNATPTGYALLWKSPSLGAHEITLRAIDSTGKPMSSAPAAVYIIPEDGPIDVTLERPRTGESFAIDSPIPLHATAHSTQGTIERVEFVDGTVVVATVHEPPFDATWQSPSIGAHAIVARAYDDFGNATASSAAYVETADSPRRPQILLTAPRNGSVAKIGTPVTYHAQVDTPDASISHVEFRGESGLIATVSSPPFIFDWTPPSTGLHQASAVVVDAAGYSGTSQLISYAVTADGSPPGSGASTGAPPSVELIAPVSGTVFATGESIDLRVNASGGAGALMRVDYLANDVVKATATGPPWSARWVGASEGAYTLVAKASTFQNAIAISSPVTVSVAPAAQSGPTIVMAAPPPGAAYYPGDELELRPAQLQVTGGVAHVDYYVDGTLAGGSTAPPYAVAWDMAEPGVHIIVAKIYDLAGREAQSLPIAISVSPLALTITTPTADSRLLGATAFVEGTYAGPSNTGITINGKVATVDGHGKFFLNDLPVLPGPGKITATATSIGGSRARFSLNVVGSYDPSTPRILATDGEGIDTLAMRIAVADSQDIAGWRILDANGTVIAQGGHTDGALTTLQFPSPGIYHPTIEVTDKSNRVILKTMAALVWSSAEIASTRANVVNRFLDALRWEQKDRVLATLTAGVAERFGGVFDALKGHWPEIIEGIAAPAGGTFGIESFEAATTRERSGQRFLYFIEGVRDSDGVWRLDSF